MEKGSRYDRIGGPFAVSAGAGRQDLMFWLPVFCRILF